MCVFTEETESKRERVRGKRKCTEVRKYESQNNIFCCYVVYEYLEIKHLCIL